MPIQNCPRTDRDCRHGDFHRASVQAALSVFWVLQSAGLYVCLSRAAQAQECGLAMERVVDVDYRMGIGGLLLRRRGEEWCSVQWKPPKGRLRWVCRGCSRKGRSMDPRCVGSGCVIGTDVVSGEPALRGVPSVVAAKLGMIRAISKYFVK